MPKPSAQVTAAEISRIAGVTRATVSNWRRRHEDFPSPAGGTDASPLYDLNTVRAWLKARGHAVAANPSEELRTVLRTHAGRDGTAMRLLPLVLAAARLAPDGLAGLEGLAPPDLLEHASALVGELSDLSEMENVRYGTKDAEALRVLLSCIKEEGALTALDVLAERELEDGVSTGAYRTPQPLADLMAELLKPTDGPYPERVLDPACGSGTLLAAAARRGSSVLAGQDGLPVQARRSAVRLLIERPEARVETRAGDSLRQDAFAGLEVDGVLCNPPFADRDWGHDELALDSRWEYGVPARAESELAWVQHALSHLAPGGLAVMLLPPAAAARPSGRRIRAALLRSGALRAVIALPAGIAAPLHIGLHLWVLKRTAPNTPHSREPVLFVDATGGGASADPAATVLGAWRSFTTDLEALPSDSEAARAVQAIDLLDDLVDFTPARNVRTAAPADPAALAGRAAEVTGRLAENVAGLSAASAVGGWRTADQKGRAWHTASVVDLVRGGALVVKNTMRGREGTEVPPEYAERAVLTGRDLATGGRASGSAAELRTHAPVVIETGDVLVPRIVGQDKPVARVADSRDAGCLLSPSVQLLRPDPERLDAWFLAGFLTDPGNLAGASSGSTALRLDARRLRVPVLPLVEQRRYGTAFLRLHELRTAARLADETAAETASVLAEGLRAGALLPPG